MTPAVVIYIAIGAAAGAVARFSVGVWFSTIIAARSDFPWATFIVNVAGSFLLGMFVRRLGPLEGRRNLHALLAVGFCGSFTTFSTFSYETIMLIEAGHGRMAIGYVGASMVAAPLACAAGYVLGGE